MAKRGKRSAVVDAGMSEASRREYAAWQDLVRQLKATGAVTEQDCNSLASASETPGQQLFAAIRYWGPLAATVTCLLLGMLCAAPASAQTPQVAEARSVFEAGQVAFDDGRYADALGYFQRSYALSHLPELLFNIALCQDRLRNDNAAMAAYEHYLDQMPNAANRAEVERRLGALQLAPVRAAAVVSPEHVAEAGSSGARDGVVPLRSGAPRKAPAVYETWWFWTVVGVVVAGTAVGIGVAASDGPELRTGDVGGVIFTLGSGT